MSKSEEIKKMEGIIKEGKESKKAKKGGMTKVPSKGVIPNEITPMDVGHPEIDKVKNAKLQVDMIYRFVAAQSVALEYFRYSKEGLWKVMVDECIRQVGKPVNKQQQRVAEKLLKEKIKKAKTQLTEYEKKIERMMGHFESNGAYQGMVDDAIDMLTDVLEKVKTPDLKPKKK